jgi:hypothetical protein
MNACMWVCGYFPPEGRCWAAQRELEIQMVGISIYESSDPHPDPISPKCAHIYTYTHTLFLPIHVKFLSY